MKDGGTHIGIGDMDIPMPSPLDLERGKKLEKEEAGEICNARREFLNKFGGILNKFLGIFNKFGAVSQTSALACKT